MTNRNSHGKIHHAIKFGKSSISIRAIFHFPYQLPFSHGFPMVFPWFSHGFPMVFPWLNHLRGTAEAHQLRWAAPRSTTLQQRATAMAMVEDFRVLSLYAIYL